MITLLFAQPIPPALAAKTGKSGTWSQAFGKLADTAFNAWYVARYVDEIAAAGQAIKNLPMYCNAALSDPARHTSITGQSGPRWSRLTSTIAIPRPMPSIWTSTRGPTTR